MTLSVLECCREAVYNVILVHNSITLQPLEINTTMAQLEKMVLLPKIELSVIVSQAE